MAHIPLSRSEPPRLPNNRALEPASADATVRLTVVLSATAERSFDAIAEQQRTLETWRRHVQETRPRNRRYLTTESLASEHGPHDRALDRVRKFAEEHRLQVEGHLAAMRQVVLQGRVRDVEEAFQVRLFQHRAKEGVYYWHEGPVQVPEELYDVIEAVVGLHTEPMDTMAHHAVVPNGLNPPVIAKAYEFPPGNASGQCIAIILLGGGFDPDDLDPYFASLGLSVPRITVVEIGNQKNSPAPAAKIEGMLIGTMSPDAETRWTIEASLDVQLIGALANGAHIVVYFAENTIQGKLEALARAATDPHGASVISCSFGMFEASAVPADVLAFDDACERAGLLGISVCVSSGDKGDGSEGGPTPRVRFPASSPNVLACGGTHAVFNAGGVLHETVWNEVFAGINFSSGGGVSGVFPLPMWQANAGVPAKPDGGSGRGVPDVSAKGDLATGYTIRVRGFTFPTGGTSAAAPLWASLCALLNQNLGARLGPVAPLLYTAEFATAFRDITVGNNGTFFSAQQGWDACTGLGSPRATALLKALS